MNLYAAAKTLETLTDQQLMAMMNSPNASIPKDYIKYEMDRRKTMRQEAAPAPVDPTPVMQSPNAMGIPSTPQMSQGGPEHFVEGGIVGYASGGPVDYYQDPMGVDSTQYMTPYDNVTDDPFAAEKAKLRALAEQMKHGAGQARDAIFPGGMAPDQRNAQYDQAMSQIQAQTPVPPVSGGYDDRQRMLNRLGASPPVTPPAPVQQAAQMNGGIRAAGGGGSRRGGVSPAMGGPMSGPSRRSQVEIPDAPPDVEKPDIQDPQAYIDMVKQNNPDTLGQLLGRTDDRLAKNDKYRSDAKNQALLAAGLGIMAGRSPNALANIGAGGLTGLKDYQQSLQSVNSREDALQQHRDSIVTAQQAAQAGNFKLAAELAERENSRNAQMYSADVQDRRWGLRDRQQAQQMQYQGDKLDQQNQIENRRLDIMQQQANSLGDYRSAKAAGGGSSREDRSDERLRKEATSVYGKLHSQYMQANKPDPFGGRNSQQIMSEADAYALSHLSPEHRAALQGAMNLTPQSSAGPQTPVLMMDSSGKIK